MNMEFLRFLEGLRTPFFDKFFSLITHLGEETIFILVGLVFFWCVNKKKGYYILSIGFAGTVINQFLKSVFRIERPWVKDKNFTIVESARAEATGYSFPSGHTQSAVGVFGSIAKLYKNKVVRILCILACVLVPFSRMYLGVHTPADVGVSIIVAVLLIFGLYPLIEKAMESKKGMRIFFGIMFGVSAAYLAFLLLYNFPADIDINNFNSAMKNAYKIMGCVLGIWLAYEIDARYINFETQAVFWVQILKLAIGIIPLLLIKSGLKAPLYALFDGNYIADSIRYFLVTLFAAGIWPMTFKWFNKLSDKK